MLLPRKLGLLDCVSIVVGIVIGGGIFLVPNLVARNLGSVPLILAVFAFINYVGVTAGATVQKSFTAAKVAGMLLIVGSAFLVRGHTAPQPPPAAFSMSSFGVALIACLLAYDGWAQLSDVAGEIR